MYLQKLSSSVWEKTFSLGLFIYTVQFLSYVSANLRRELHIYFNYGTVWPNKIFFLIKKNQEDLAGGRAVTYFPIDVVFSFFCPFFLRNEDHIDISDTFRENWFKFTNFRGGVLCRKDLSFFFFFRVFCINNIKYSEFLWCTKKYYF